MPRDSQLPPESFDEILAWLDSDRDVAASMYLQLREDLERMFRRRLCSDPQGLVDETFDRVARKLHEVKPTYDGDPRLFFYGFARNLVKEDLKKIKSYASLDEIPPLLAPLPEAEHETEDMRRECLGSCLQHLSTEKRELILKYYAREKQAKIDHRAELARRLSISIGTLRVRVYRIRETLEKCIEDCLDVKAAQRK